MNEEMPYKAYDLVKMLDDLFPLTPVNLNMTEREIFFAAGQRYVVDFLLKRYMEDER